MTDRLRVLDLFSGIGGFSLGLERTGGFETVAFCEIEEYPRAVLRKHWPDVPIFKDVRKLTGDDVGPVDVICGGYPCQPFSLAGQRRGAEDDRHLWPEFNRLVVELRPAWVIGENVAGHIGMGLDDVLSDLEKQGYACRTFVIPACAVGAPHRRDRCWTIGKAPSLAHAEKLQRDGGEEYQKQSSRQVSKPRKRGGAVSLAHADSERPQGRAQAGNAGSVRAGREKQLAGCGNLPRSAWPPEPSVGRVADGVPRGVDRLRALGNAVVPQIPEMIGHAILAAEAGND